MMGSLRLATKHLVKPILLTLLIIGSLPLLLVAVLIILIMADGLEPQDIRITAAQASGELYFDGEYVGNSNVCLPQIKQGKHTIAEISNGERKEISVAVYDVSIKIFPPLPLPTSPTVKLSNCGGAQSASI